MTESSKSKGFLWRFLDVGDERGSWGRRRRVTRGLLFVVFVAGVALVATAIATTVAGMSDDDTSSVLVVGGVIGTWAAVGLLLEVFGPRWGGGASLALGCLIGAGVILAYGSDETVAVATLGAAVALTALVLPAATAFGVAAGGTVLLVGAKLLGGHQPDLGVPTLLFVEALSCWLAAATLERAASQAQAEADRNAAILQAMSDGVLVLDEEWRVVRTNPAVLEMGGGSLEGLLAVATGSADEAEALWVDQWEGLAANPSARLETGEKVLAVQVSPMDAEGVSAGSVAVLHDLTREVETERGRHAMFALAAHEARTDIHTLSNLTALWQEGVRESHGVPIPWRIALSARRIAELLENVVHLARLEAGLFVPLDQRFDAVVAVQDVLQSLEGLASEADLTLELVEGSKSVPVCVDLGVIKRIVSNLVTNGLKFTQQGGVYVTVGEADEGRWQVTVTDTGAGMSSEVQQRLFVAFEVGVDPVSRSRRGAGLGLALVKRYVDLMEGSVMLESEEGQGTTVTVVLPTGVRPVECDADRDTAHRGEVS